MELQVTHNNTTIPGLTHNTSTLACYAKTATGYAWRNVTWSHLPPPGGASDSPVCSKDYVTDLSSGLPIMHRSDQWSPEVMQRVVTLTIIMTLTLLGNVCIISVLTCSKSRKLSSRVNIFILNLAIGDLSILCFTMTTELLFVVFDSRWVLGDVLCKLLLYIQIVTLASTTFILTAMSYDRYLAVCRPMQLKLNLQTHARRLILLCWALAFLFALPQLAIFKVVAVGVYPGGAVVYGCKSRGYTHWWQRKLYFTFLATYILLLPTAIICYCYVNVVRVVWNHDCDVITGKNGSSLRRERRNKSISKSKIRTIQMSLCIIFSFILCWTPYFVVHLIHIWSEYTYKIAEWVYVFAETLALVNSAINPLLYGCFNMKIKSGLAELCCPGRERQKRSFRLQCMMSDYLSETQTMSIRSRTKGDHFDGGCGGSALQHKASICSRDSLRKTPPQLRHHHKHNHTYNHTSNNHNQSLRKYSAVAVATNRKDSMCLADSSPRPTVAMTLKQQPSQCVTNEALLNRLLIGDNAMSGGGGGGGGSGGGGGGGAAATYTIKVRFIPGRGIVGVVKQTKNKDCRPPKQRIC